MWLKPDEAAKALGVSRRTVRRLAERGEIPRNIVHRSKAEYWVEPETEPGAAPVPPTDAHVERHGALEFGVVLSDIHIPNHDRRALDAAIDLIRVEQPAHVILNGDILDIESCSSHGGGIKTPGLDDEIEMGIRFLERIRSAVPHAKIVWVEGNHEERVARYLAHEAPALHGVVGFAELMRLEYLGIDFIPYGRGAAYVIGDLTVGHGWWHNIHHAKNHLDKMPHVIQECHGHTHRAQTYVQGTMGGGYRAGHGAGCLCKLEQGYLRGRATGWVHGFLTFWLDVRNQTTHVNQVVMRDRQFVYNGRRYGSQSTPHS